MYVTEYRPWRTTYHDPGQCSFLGHIFKWKGTDLHPRDNPTMRCVCGKATWADEVPTITKEIKPDVG